ncbi:NACHT, LRR and PYD domains-containing protein 3-like isoform X1 [Synchiropus splendidus]|uniref:NACHT, LRR and PYD domains-containing protein 3-like isoform X1 n=2 Tax=Synchiropus splendidus TaxID=270530 RepID=UPI00237DB820|nr:NACHT, LRR and PYD domains-containing protein 3-like isoform X1 [Synchiropus splendidus]XP_053733353.1 NACHT, LRR and PYD domains-containing protein 3-like isoform X1 [Synchiropus splendidus]XP_053733354.1 NACHT, LRR and PYD domains-containing protein 3-like isoform X1 [Synchiropus splendidus]
METRQELLRGLDREEEAAASNAPQDLASQTRAQRSEQLTSNAAEQEDGDGRSMDKLIDFKGGQECADDRIFQEEPEESSGEREDQQVSDLRVQQHQTDLDSTLQLLEETVMTLVKKEVRSVQRFLSPDDPKYQDEEEEVKLKCDEEQMRSSREAFLDFIMNLLRSMEEVELADRVWSRSRAGACAERLKRSLQKKFYGVFEGVAKAGNSAPLNQIYTELYITEGGIDQVNQEHEVRQIEAATRNQTRAETTIRQEDLFKASPEREGPIRSLLTKGVAGIGKTLLTQKLTLDWAEDKAHQNLQLVFPFTFRELNLLKEKQLSLVELVHRFFPETKDSGLSSFEGVQVLFILDGLDECRLPLDFNSRFLTEATESTSVDVLLTNLISGKLLPSAQLWITTRPAAVNQIPPECVDMVTEVRGFTDLQKEEYFRKRFRDEEQTTIISHIRSSRSLHIMCHIPIFCWITATVLEDMLKSRESGELPKTLTEMYIHFLVVQAKVKKLKYHGGAGTDTVWDPESRKMIESLGKLAFEQLQRGNLIFYESDLTECGIDITAAAVYSGVFTQIFREERGLYQDKVFCFIHLSLQEFLAALHVHLKFFNSGVNLLHSQQTSIVIRIFRNKHLAEQFYQRAINEAVESPNGHLDLFLRFLLGLSLPSSQRLLQGLLTKTGSSSWTHQDTAELIKKKISEKVSPERIINLFHCLSEVKDTSLVEEVQQQLRSGRLSTKQLSPAQWSTLAFILLSSEEDLEVFDLKKFSASERALERLLVVVQASKAVLLKVCNLSERSGSLLSSVLSSPSSCLTQLDLNYNNLKDPGVELLCAGLKSPHCHLETLSLSRCFLSERSGSLLSSVLSSPSSRLTQLDLSYNDLKDPGAELLCAGLKSPHCHLETLSLSWCFLSERGCSLLSSVLSSPSSRLTQLDLNYNNLKDPGVEQLCAGLKSPHCHLETLSLTRCFLSERSGSLLSSVLSSPSSRLTQLDLSYNYDLKDPGVEQLCAGLKSPHCHLENLSLSRCNLSGRSGSLLSSVLSSPSSRLTQLDLSYNDDLEDPGVEPLCAGLKSPHCHLETVSLSGCSISERGCASLASALTSNPSHLRELDLSFNHPRGPGLELLSAGLESPDWRLETLRLDHCGPQRLTSGLQRYFRPLSLDPDTAHRRLLLSNNNSMVELVTEDQDYLDHDDRFERCPQVMSRDAVTGPCYWELEWRGRVSVAVTLRRDGGKEDESEFGQNPYSWSLSCSDDAGYKFCHNKGESVVESSEVSHRVAVVVNSARGVLEFSRVSSGIQTPLLIFFTPTEPLYLGFGLREVPGSGSSVRLCDLSV